MMYGELIDNEQGGAEYEAWYYGEGREPDKEDEREDEE